jgi:TRAP-type C4-dicarboxylate transport system permease small subunit
MERTMSLKFKRNLPLVTLLVVILFFLATAWGSLPISAYVHP